METAACKNSLGELHWVGAGVDRNLTRARGPIKARRWARTNAIVEAKELFEEAAAVGEPDAQYNLAILYASTESSEPLAAIKLLLAKSGVEGEHAACGF